MAWGGEEGNHDDFLLVSLEKLFEAILSWNSLVVLFLGMIPRLACELEICTLPGQARSPDETMRGQPDK